MTKELLGSLELNRIYQRDCLEASMLIESGSVDLILTDLPYGTVEKIADSDKVNHGMKGKTEWDVAIEPQKIYEIANRILRKNGKMVLFSQEPYTTRLINEAVPNIPFSYRMIWEKDHFANSLIAKKAPVSYYEDVLVLAKSDCYEAKHPLRETMLKYVDKHGKDRIIELFSKEGRYTSDLSTRVHASYKFGFNKGMRFDLMDFKMFKFLSEYIAFEESYEDLKRIDEKYKQKYSSTFNLWEGKRYKSNILKYKKDYDGFHPTQKPVLLLEDLIKTFSNAGDLVVDLTCGSGSTCVAAARTNRKFIGFETEPSYIEIANKRIDDLR
jgi:site-specific DNA-methyltransferase (adenine-specific)